MGDYLADLLAHEIYLDGAISDPRRRALDFKEGFAVVDNPLTERKEVTALAATGAQLPGRLAVEADTTALYHFNQSIADAGPNNLALEFFGTSTERYAPIVPGYWGLYQKGNVDALRSVALNSPLIALTGAMTFEVIYAGQTTNLSASAPVIAFHGTSSTGGPEANNKAWQVQVRDTGGALTWSQQHGSLGQGTSFVVDSRMPPMWSPVYLAWTRGSDQIVRTYMNGELLGTSSALTLPVVGANGRLTIGGANHFEQILGEMRISNTARSDAQIKAAYNATLGRHFGLLP